MQTQRLSVRLQGDAASLRLQAKGSQESPSHHSHEGNNNSNCTVILGYALNSILNVTRLGRDIAEN